MIAVTIGYTFIWDVVIRIIIKHDKPPYGRWIVNGSYIVYALVPQTCLHSTRVCLTKSNSQTHSSYQKINGKAKAEDKICALQKQGIVIYLRHGNMETSQDHIHHIIDTEPMMSVV